MSFLSNTARNSGARSGFLNLQSSTGNVVLDTPNFFVHTRGGSVTHLSHSLLQKVTKTRLAVQLPLINSIESLESIRAFGKGLTEFAGLKGYPSYLSVQDAAESTPTGYHDKTGISIWPRSGRKQIEANKYISAIEAFQPSIFQALCDGDTCADTSNKRLTKVVNRTISLLDECIKLKEASPALKETALWGSIEGGYSVKERIRCTEQVVSRDVDGFVLDGFHMNGPVAEELIFQDLKPVLDSVLVLLPKHKPVLFPGPISPLLTLQLISEGVDLFDGSYVYLVTERGGALSFPISTDRLKVPLPCETVPVLGEFVLPQSDIKTDIRDDLSKAFEIRLVEKKYFNDPKPLLENCICYTCRQFSRSYIHHLLVTKELLGPMLLMMHNLHHYLEFFKNIRTAIDEDQFPELVTVLKEFVVYKS
nr:EOG090X08JG [Lepidurus arcticus]